MKRIRELRKEKGMTQLQLQMKIGIDQSDYSKIERGLRYPTVDQLISLAGIFETSIDYIVELTDKKEPYPRKSK
ncbi:MAG: helix-turn-helix transcriptional regulator [Oscillospiraceae bacterium]|nr:helix-turn-helix transcriptional regulator [Oscillospiraceae bacterium]